MVVSHADRRKAREHRAAAAFGAGRAEVALDLLELTELAWHDCYQTVTPPEEVIEDMFLLSDGSIERLVQAARLAVTDWRDLKIAAQERRVWLGEH